MPGQEISGAATGAAAGAVFGPVGAVIGGVLGFAAGAGGAAAEREQFRANREAEARRNVSLVAQAKQIGEVGQRTIGGQRLGFGAAAVRGGSATQASVQLDSLRQTFRDQESVLAGVSSTFQGRSPKSAFQKFQESDFAKITIFGEPVKKFGKQIENEFRRFKKRLKRIF